MSCMNPPQCTMIFAGYPDKMEEFLDTNEGLRRRITYKFEFDDYRLNNICEFVPNYHRHAFFFFFLLWHVMNRNPSLQDLATIFRIKVKEHGEVLTPEADNILEVLLFLQYHFDLLLAFSLFFSLGLCSLIYIYIIMELKDIFSLTPESIRKAYNGGLVEIVLEWVPYCQYIYLSSWSRFFFFFSLLFQSLRFFIIVFFFILIL